MNQFLISLIPIILLFFLKLKKSFHMLQQNWYNKGNRYLRWINRNFRSNFLNLEIIFCVVIFLSGILKNITPYVILVLYSLLYIFKYKEFKNEQVKKKLVITSRVKRLLATTMIVYGIPLIFIIKSFDVNNIVIYYSIICLMVYMVYYIALIINIINIPVEKLVYLYYYAKASNRLNNINNMDVIGITGSYGKTSSKNILYDILSVKYNVFKTPLNYNTPYGLCNTVNNYLDKFNDYFIAEMGAVKVGEIKKCCNLVKPKYGIITKIGTAHLETFKTQENILKTKFELIESLKEDGIGILNGDDKLQLDYKIKNKCRILTVGITNQNVDLYATNIRLSNKGTTFECKFKNEDKLYEFQTNLLGYNNIYNLLTGILLGYTLGIDIEKLQYATKLVKPVEHRLELKKSGDINIIDDAYNSNPEGSKMAVEVLGMMPGLKICVTPGMIELGKEQYTANKKFGTYIADNADVVILVGEKQTKPIYDGLKEKKYDEKNIYVINDVKEAFSIINRIKEKETYVLLENDLPDVFNE